SSADCGELAWVTATAVPPVPVPNPVAVAVYRKVVPVGMAVTTKVPSYPVRLTPVTATLPPRARPTGFAALVIVTVVPLSVADEIGTGVNQDGLLVPSVQVPVPGLN